tara:strand:- start:2344 stop:2712 length:369 start_codon:yes stop_codon:yes gene_type:complete
MIKDNASPHFKWSEFACKCGCGCTYVSQDAIDKLEELRVLLGAPIQINSACRCPIHNAKIGGAPMSQHRSTKTSPSTAFDIAIGNHDKQDIISLAERVGFGGIGIKYNTFVHVDDRPNKARW